MDTILIIEDNLELASLLQAFLKKEGFLCYHATSGEEGMHWLESHKAKVILLDIMLPGIDGFAFCKYVRHTRDTPILIMSARSTKEDKLMGFELGADDYMEKPVDADILCAKVRALINRIPSNITTQVITSGSLQIDKMAHKVYLDTQPLDINVKEYELLLLLVENTGKTLQKEYLFNQVWGNDCMSENQTLTVHIKMLRSKIEVDSRNPKRIQTVWGIGYRYEEI